MLKNIVLYPQSAALLPHCTGTLTWYRIIPVSMGRQSSPVTLDTGSGTGTRPGQFSVRVTGRGRTYHPVSVSKNMSWVVRLDLLQANRYWFEKVGLWKPSRRHDVESNNGQSTEGLCVYELYRDSSTNQSKLIGQCQADGVKRR